MTAALGGILLALGPAGVAHAAPVEGIIFGQPTHNVSTDQAHIDNLSVKFTCQVGGPQCHWHGYAEVRNITCSGVGPNPPQPVWTSPTFTADGTTTSGPLDFPVQLPDRGSGFSLCLFVVYGYGIMDFGPSLLANMDLRPTGQPVPLTPQGEQSSPAKLKKCKKGRKLTKRKCAAKRKKK